MVRIGRGLLVKAGVVVGAVGAYLWLVHGLTLEVPRGCFSQAYMDVPLHAARCNALGLAYQRDQDTRQWLTWGLVFILALTAIPSRIWALVMADDTM